MKREDVKKIFPNATDEEIDSILNQVGSELNPLKEQLNTANTALADAKSELESTKADAASQKAKADELAAKVQEGMSAEELLAEREKAAADKERDFILKSNTLDAKSIFVAAGVPDDQMEGLLAQVVSEDTDKTKQLAENICALVKSQKESAVQATKDELLKNNPHLGGADGDGAGITKEQFSKLGYKEQEAMLKDNPDLLKSFEKPVSYPIM